MDIRFRTELEAQLNCFFLRALFCLGDRPTDRPTRFTLPYLVAANRLAEMDGVFRRCGECNRAFLPHEYTNGLNDGPNSATNIRLAFTVWYYRAIYRTLYYIILFLLLSFSRFLKMSFFPIWFTIDTAF